jgi:hypothetical protein
MYHGLRVRAVERFLVALGAPEIPPIDERPVPLEFQEST